MRVMWSKRFSLRRSRFVWIIITVICVVYFLIIDNTNDDVVIRETDLDSIRRDIQRTLADALKLDKGSGCNIPKLDPFAKEITQFDENLPDIVCEGLDWVRCYHSVCKVVPEILATTKHISCTYEDIIYDSDVERHLGPGTVIKGDNKYILTKSDHVKISCTGRHNWNLLRSKWTGYATGFRTTVERKPLELGREDGLKVLIFGFDSTSRNGFIRRMPKSYKYLTEELKATVLNGYNIVGDATPSALFPILTGKTELELPDVRKGMNKSNTCDVLPFIFYKLKNVGYRTAYFEDLPKIGTFQYRFNGFRHQPADHYLRALLLEDLFASGLESLKVCVGDTPQHKLLMNLTDQFMLLDGKKFIFTFIADITHSDFNQITTADVSTMLFFKTLKERRVLEDYLIIIMADHGPRYALVRSTYQGKLEERLPLMAVLLPEKLKQKRPNIQSILEENANTLTTPHDIHATLLDVLDMKQHYNPYKVEGADLPRGMTLLERIPRSRSCSEAGIEPHWCACLTWHHVSNTESIYQKAVDALIEYINSLTDKIRSKCLTRTLTEVEWVMRQSANNRMLLFEGAKDWDQYVGKFNAKVKYESENYQVKVVVAPGRGVFEATLKYFIADDRFIIYSRDISRTNLLVYFCTPPKVTNRGTV